jgi:hypothetical protein
LNLAQKLMVVALSLCTLAGCSHTPISGRAVNRMIRPALVARIEDGAGPRSLVFQGDGSYGGKLKKLDPKEADRRLQVKLQKGVSRFEVSDSLRANTLAQLPQQAPWSQAVHPAEVARALESFLVEEVPANAPDYDLLKPLGADSVVEFVIEEYGMRSSGGRAGLYVLGYARMFFLDGGGNQYVRKFRADEVQSGLPHLDPFRVAKDPTLFRRHMTDVMIKVAELLARDLNPQRGADAVPAASEGGDVKKDAGRPAQPKKESSELPDPDPI